MKTFIREHLKIVLAVTTVTICMMVFLIAKETMAKTSAELPSVSKLTVVAFEIKEDAYVYTGEPIETTIIRIVLEDEIGERMVVYGDQCFIEEYSHQVDCGYADLKVSIEGYQGTVDIERAFQIKPKQVQGLTITEASLEHIQLVWNEIPGAHGYLLYKSKDNGTSYMPIKEAIAGEELSYQDQEIQLNETYLYQVKAFVKYENETIFGEASSPVEQDTPLERAALKSVSSISSHSIKVQWTNVARAAGYQIYRSDSKNGPFTCVAEIMNGAATSYTDENCELGMPYYYYIKAAQSTNNTIVYGDASEVLSAKTTPDKPTLSGVTGEKNTAVTLSWSRAEGAQGYEIYKSENPSSGFQLVATIDSGDTLNWSETGLNDKATYYYKIRSCAVINGAQLFSIYSGVYEKDITVVYVELSEEISVLMQYVGRQYVYGGTSPTNGWDCSAFTQYVFKTHFGVNLLRTAAEQASGGTNVSKTNRAVWQPGDLLFYKEKGQISHVAIYLGNNQMIHALNSTYDTLIQDVDYYETWDTKNSLYCVKRYLK